MVEREEAGGGGGGRAQMACMGTYVIKGGVSPPVSTGLGVIPRQWKRARTTIKTTKTTSATRERLLCENTREPPL